MQDYDETAALKKAIKQSIEDAQQAVVGEEDDELELALKISAARHEHEKIEELRIPLELVAPIKKLRYNFEFELGVKIYLASDDGISYKLRIVHRDDDILLIAKSTLQHMIAEPSQFEARISKLKEERVHIFVDNSNICIGSQCQVKPHSGTDKGRESIVRDASIRLQYPALAGLVEGNRNCLEKLVFGSILAGDSLIWRKWERLGYSVHIAQV